MLGCENTILADADAARLRCFAQTTLNLSQDLVKLGIAATNMVPNQPTLDAGPPFFRAVLYAQNHQIGRVIADPGAISCFPRAGRAESLSYNRVGLGKEFVPDRSCGLSRRNNQFEQDRKRIRRSCRTLSTCAKVRDLVPVKDCLRTPHGLPDRVPCRLA